jgi:hypothetical protein
MIRNKGAAFSPAAPALLTSNQLTTQTETPPSACNQHTVPAMATSGPSSSTAACERIIAALSNPELVGFLDLHALLQFPLINRCTSAIVSQTNHSGISSHWLHVCRAYAAHFGLYVTTDVRRLLQNPRKYLFDELVIAKHKWDYAADDSTAEGRVQRGALNEFKIKVSCRFRPGKRGNQNMFLPLHQFIKVRRDAAASKVATSNAAPSSSASAVLLGEVDPAEFCDPILGTLMRDPVLLASSGRVCERALAVQCIARGGADPFTGAALSLGMLLPQPELAARIAAWRAKKQQGVDVTVGVAQVASLIEQGSADPELLEALMEAERIGHIARRANRDANRRARLGPAAEWGNDDDDDKDGDGDDDGYWAAASHAASGMHAAATSHEAESGASAAASGWTGEDDDFSGTGNSSARGSSHEHAYNNRFGPTSKGAHAARVIDINESKARIAMHVAGTGVRPFQFANVYDGGASQRAVFEGSVGDSVVAALNGFNACVLCYGQTGSGKTHTSFGPDGALATAIHDVDHVPDSAGLVVRACAELLRAKAALAARGVHVTLTAQFVELYEEQVTDLLSGAQIAIRRETGDLLGASEAPLDTGAGMDAVLRVLRHGQERKRFAATAMNERSSRSHTAFIVQIAQTREAAACGSSGSSSDRGGSSGCESRLVRSQLHLIDLAGSERIKKSNVTGVHKTEAVGINSSLLVLGKVIAALLESQRHVPYLESKLTTLLRGAFGGNSRTSAIVTCRADDAHGDETLQTLRFGERCAMVSNTTRATACSLAGALSALDEALARVGEQCASLERRGKQHLDSHQKLAASLAHLRRRRDELGRAAANKTKTATTSDGGHSTRGEAQCTSSSG